MNVSSDVMVKVRLFRATGLGRSPPVTTEPQKADETTNLKNRSRLFRFTPFVTKVHCDVRVWRGTTLLFRANQARRNSEGRFGNFVNSYE